jgi:hypothetical protein
MDERKPSKDSGGRTDPINDNDLGSLPSALSHDRFGQHLSVVRAAMEELACSLPPGELARQAFQLYERFRPAVPEGEAGWGAAGMLDLGQITALAKA